MDSARTLRAGLAGQKGNIILVLIYKNKRKLRDLSKEIPHFEWQQQGEPH